MSPIKHFISGIVLGSIFYVVTRDPNASIVTGVAAVGSDIDHLIEYCIFCANRRKKLSKDEFFKGSYFEEKGTIIVIFHAYEYILALIAALIICLSIGSSVSIFVCAIMIGYSLHIVLDVIGNDLGIVGYSLIYRIRVRFNECKLCHKQI